MMTVFDDIKEIHSLAQRIITLAEGRGGESALKARAQVEHDHDERKTETRYAVGDLYAPRDGYIADAFHRPSQAFSFTPPDGPDTMYIWKIKPDGGAVQIAAWNEQIHGWSPLTNDDLTEVGGE